MGLSIPIIDTIVEKIVEVVTEGLVRHFRILIHYKENLENLKNEMKELEKQREKIDDKVKQVETEGEVFSDADKSEISTWVNLVGEKEKDINEFLEAEEDNMKCFRFSCPNYISRGRRSKRAEKKKTDVEKLKTQGEKVLLALRPHRRDREFTVTDFIKFESRESAFQDIVEAIKDSKFSMVLVHGVGGVGKTKMVEKVMEKVKEDGCFDELVMVVVSNNVDEKKIQDDLASALHFKLETDNKDRRASDLKNRLKNGKRNLIILDDVWERLDLKDIGIPTPDETKCCKILMTSRNQEVCKNLQFDRKIQMKVLLEKEAWKLFKMKAGNSIESDELKNVAKAVCDECAGLPVAIVAVGEALKDKDKNYWEDALEQLRNFMLENVVDINPKVYASLKLSYTCLTQEDQRKCFLLCCLFPEDADIPIDELVKHCMAGSLLECKPDTMEKARKRVLTVVGSLRSRCLLLDGTNVKRETVKMHDIIRAVAISLAKNDEAFRVTHGLRNWQVGMSTEVKIRKKHYLAISLQIEDICELPDEVCSEVDTLLLKCSNSSLEISLEKVFSRMKELKILELEGMHVSSLPSSFRNLVNLRMLCLRKCQLENIAMIKVLREKMEILSLQDSKIKALPPEIGQLSGLRVLDLGNCYMLKVIPNGIISQLTRLEELYIYDFKEWAEAKESNKETCNASLDELRKLERLTTLHLRIPTLMLWPKDLRFGKLIRFKISLGEYPYPKYEDYSESILELCDCVLKDEVYVLLGKAQTLYLDKVEGLRKVLHDRDGEVFPNLKYFQVSNCGDFQFWLTQIHLRGSFYNLTKLHIRRCKDLKYLCSPSCTRVLTQLEDLLVEDCEMMEAIVGTEGEIVDEKNLTYFNRLKKMSLLSLPNLTSFCPETKKTSIEGSPSNHARSLFTEKMVFPSLESLVISGLPKITSIWPEKLLIGKSFCQLRFISIMSCDEILNLVSLGMLPPLQNLEELRIMRCAKMNVVISDTEIEKAPSNDNTIEFPHLTHIYFSELHILKCFYGGDGKHEVQALFNHKVAFPVLEYLSIDGLPNFTHIWDMQDLTSRSTESFSQLRTIGVYNCDKLIYVFDVDMLMQLQNLKTLSVQICLNLKVIVSADKANKKDWSLPELECLILSGLGSLIGFCNCCEKSGAQVPLFDHPVAFPALEDLNIDGLPNFTHIWDMQDQTSHLTESFSQLRTIDVYRCDKLIYVFDVDMLMQLQILEKLKVGCCLNLKVIVSADKANKKDWILPKLESLELCYLRNLIGFCNCCGKSGAQVPLFNHQVRFTSLKQIIIDGLPNITLLWQEQSVSQFQHVRSILIYDCENMGVLISEEGKKEEEEEEDNSSIIIFPQLWRARFHGLKNFKGLCTIRSRGHQFFRRQVVFPALEHLDIKKVPKITEVLKRKIKPQLQCKEQLSVGDIQNMEMIDSENGKDYKEKHIILQVEFPKLRVLLADGVLYRILQENGAMGFHHCQRYPLKAFQLLFEALFDVQD